jgi:LacI family transcriptional regulator
MVYCSGGGDPRLSPVVALDDFAAGKLAGEHLLGLGITNFGFVGSSRSYRTIAQRLAGFRQPVEAKGYGVVECPVPVVMPREEISHPHRPAMIKWLRSLPKPVGIMAFDDWRANDLAATCLEADIAVPDQVAIIGVNNDDLLCESAWPPLSSVEAEYSRVGFKAAEILDRQLAGEVLVGDDRLVLMPPLGVVQRQSTNVQAIKDPNLVRARRFIGEHACDPCSVDDVLRVVPVNRRWLERNFASHFGRTVHNEITRVRIETAKRLLRGSEFSLDAIAARCGFAESKRFYVVFRNVTGTTPAAYRRSASARSPAT